MEYTTDELFGVGVRERREELGWSMTELANRLQQRGLDNFHATTVSRVESGQRPIRLSEAQTIVDIFNDELGSSDQLNDYLYPPLSGSEELANHLLTIENFAEAAASELRTYRRLLRELPDKIQEVEEYQKNGRVPEGYRELVKDDLQRAKEFSKEDHLQKWLQKFESMSKEEWNAYRNKRRRF